MQDQLLTAAQREEIDRRVTAGLAAFDEHAPEGWAQLLSENEARLDVGDIMNCPCTIVFGSYEDGLRALGVPAGQGAANLGVSLYSGDQNLDYPVSRENEDYDPADDDRWTDEAFAALSDAWRRGVVARLLP